MLLIGACYSAEDIGVRAFEMGARSKMGDRSVTISYRTAPMGYDRPDGMEELPLVHRFDGETVHFTGGTDPSSPAPWRPSITPRGIAPRGSKGWTTRTNGTSRRRRRPENTEIEELVVGADTTPGAGHPGRLGVNPR